VDQFSRPDDQGDKRQAQQRPAQDHQRHGEAPDRNSCRDLGCNEAPRHQGGDTGRVGRQPSEVLEECADGNPQRPCGARNSSHCTSHGLERRGGCHCQLI